MHPFYVTHVLIVEEPAAVAEGGKKFHITVTKIYSDKDVCNYLKSNSTNNVC